MRDPGVRKIKALVARRGGQYLGKSDMRKPETVGKYERTKAPKGMILVCACYNPYPQNVSYFWLEPTKCVWGKQLGVNDVGDLRESA